MEQKFDFSQADPLFVEVARFVVENNRMALVSPLERKFDIGFNRSKRILEQLEAAGIVGEAVRCKPRTVRWVGRCSLVGGDSHPRIRPPYPFYRASAQWQEGYSSRTELLAHLLGTYGKSDRKRTIQ